MKVSNLYLATFLVAVSAIFWVSVHGKNISKKKNEKKARIVNGNEVEPHSLPYMVAIRSTIDDKSVLCGGSLLTTSLILTAAQCVSGATEAEITLGAHNLDESEDTQQQFTSKAFVIHEEYEPGNKTHDIAIIQLPAAVTLDDNINTIVLPTLDDLLKNYDEMTGIVAGWGKAKDTDSTTSSVLRSVEVTIIPTIMCELSYLFSIGLDQMCTSGVSQKNICLGDTGSPLVVDGVQVGIALYGSDFGCEVGFPGVYTKLQSYLGWLLVGVEAYGEES